MDDLVMKREGYSKDIRLILIASFFYMASPMMVTPLIAGFSRELGATGIIMGMIGGLMNLCSLFCRPFVGTLTDRISKYHFASIGSILMVLATIGYAVAPNMPVVVISRLANGVGFSCCSVCMSTWMSDMLPKEKIGSGMGLYGTMNALSMAIAPALGIWLMDTVGYRLTFLLSAVFAIATFVIIQFVKNKGVPIVRTAGIGSRFSVLEIKVLPIALIVMFFAIPYCATQSFLVSYVNIKQVTVSVTLFFPLYALILLVLRLALKSKFDKWSFNVFFWAGCICALISMLGLTYLSNNLMMILAATFMAGGYGIMCSVSQSTAILLAGHGKRGVANSTYYIGLDLGMALGPVLGGVLFEAVSYNVFYPCLMVCVPVGIIVYGVWKFAGRRYTYKSQ